MTKIKLAVKRECKVCMGGSRDLILDCPSKGCKLWDVRSGNWMGYNKRKTVREFCLDCVGGVKSEVRNCTSKECNLYAYRMGR